MKAEERPGEGRGLRREKTGTREEGETGMNRVRAHHGLERNYLVKSDIACSHYRPIENRAKRVIKMAQVVKLLTAKHSDLSSIPGLGRWEERMDP